MTMLALKMASIFIPVDAYETIRPLPANSRRYLEPACLVYASSRWILLGL